MKRCIVRMMFVVAIIGLITHCFAASDLWLIKPYGVRELAVGDSAQQVMERYGRKNVVYRKVSPDSGNEFYILEIQLGEGADADAYLDAPFDLAATSGRIPLVTGISISNPKFKTLKGIGVGSTVGDLAKAHKKPTLFNTKMRCGCAATISGARSSEEAFVYELDYGDGSCCSTEEAEQVPNGAKITAIIIGNY